MLKGKISPKETALFFLFLIWFIEILVIGRLFLIEAVFLFLTIKLSFGNLKELLKENIYLRRILLLWLLWFMTQILTDWYRGTPFLDYSRGWAKIFFFGINIIALTYLIDNQLKRVIIFLVAYNLGSLFGLIFFPNEYFLGGTIWKFGIGWPTTVLITLISIKINKRWLPIASLLAMGIVNLFLDFRSAALFCMMAATLIMISKLHHFLKQKYQRDRKLLPRIPLYIIAIISTCLVLWYFYNYAGSHEISIDVGQRKNFSGLERNPLYGRLDVLVGLKAALDSPIIGHGSWARDMTYVHYSNKLRLRLGLKKARFRFDLIPSHSYLVGAWVEAGLIGLIFWLLIFFYTLGSLRYIILQNHLLIAVFTLLLSRFIWDIWFSPFGAAARITSAHYIVIINIILLNWRKQKNALSEKNKLQAHQQTYSPAEKKSFSPEGKL